MKSSEHRAGQQELASEKVHLNFATLPTSVVHNPVETNGRRLRRPSRLDVEYPLVTDVVAQFIVSDFVRYEKCLLESCAYILVKYEAILRNEDCTTIIQ